MTDQPPPYPKDPPTSGPRPVRRTRIALAVGAAIAAGAIFGAGVLVGSSGRDDDSPRTAARGTQAATAEDDGYWPDAETEDPEYDTVDVDSFEIELRTTSRKCFGSAGCNIEVEPDLTYLGDSDNLDPDATYELTYEIRGGEDGPVLDTLELTNQSDISYSGSPISTVSSGTKLTVRITDVRTR